MSVLYRAVTKYHVPAANVKPAVEQVAEFPLPSPTWNWMRLFPVSYFSQSELFAAVAVEPLWMIVMSLLMVENFTHSETDLSDCKLAFEATARYCEDARANVAH